MNKCPECRMLIQDGLDKCPNCGAEIPGVTPRYGASVSRPSAVPARPAPSTIPTARKRPTVTVVGFVLSLIPCFPIHLVGLVLGIVGLYKIADKPTVFRGRGLSIAAIILGAVWLVVPILAALLVPSLTEYGIRSKQAEARTLLRQVQAAQGGYFQQHRTYASTFADLSVEGPVIYYGLFLADDAMQPIRPFENSHPTYASPAGYRAIAAGNLDKDATLDAWAIDHTGKLEHLVDDLEE